MSLKPKSVAIWAAVPLLAMNLIACGDDEEVPPIIPTPGELCGNGEVDEGEECDDGNRDSRDNCTVLCTRAECGDSFVQGDEECDDGNNVETDGCNNECEGPVCGNGVVEGNEACDGGANCTAQCRPTTCGDGTVQAPEECDDGDADNTDGCTVNCLSSKCGDGFVQGEEECDLGSSNSNRGACTAECEEATCGDGLVEVGRELCDDGNQDNDDECTNRCTLPTCGDGVVQEGEPCDDGNSNETDACTSSCVPTGCGDGVRQGDEECDDGNASQRDECLNDCTVPECGDGIISGDEVCDDGEENGPFPARCSDRCTLTNCGNGELDPGEECDEGEDNAENASCLLSCEWNVCGDGFAYTVETPGNNNPGEPEDCDDANDNNNDACTEACEWNSCGDGFRYTQAYNDEYDSADDGNPDEDNPFFDLGLEQCDDGNTSNTDSCISTMVGNIDGEPVFLCGFNRCGDGQVYTTVTDDTNPFGVEECDDNNPNNNDSCLDSCEFNSCGDGFLYESVTIPANPNDEEDCDDGNDADGDSCVLECEVAICGDGVVQRGVESCDDGGAAGGCPNTCQLDTCGNGFVDDGEECDDNNDNDNDSCLSTCHWNSCGDGVRYMAVNNTGNPNPIEQCDDGNGLERDNCLASCEWNSCGDGAALTEFNEYDADGENCPEGRFGQVCDIDLDRTEEDGEEGDCVQGGANPMDECYNPFYDPTLVDEDDEPTPELEDCDEGPDSPDTDSCTGECTFNVCGDGIRYETLSDPRNPLPLEACDDAGDSSSCTFECTVVTCGDGIISPLAGENCDPEASPWDEDGGCTACIVDTCGNGEVDDYEDCDDGNTNDTDTCTNNCFVARCGDGILQAGEDCDDGNTDPTDECTNTCEEARCGDGIRQTGEEQCDAGELEDDINDDGFEDTSGFCTNTCQLQCFESPARPWAQVFNDETCVFVPEPADDDGSDGDYTDLEEGYLTFVQAQQYCDNLGIGANLVKIENGAKNDFVVNLLHAIADEAGSDEYEVADQIPCPIDEDTELPIDDDGGDPELCTGPVVDQPYWIGLYDNHTTQPDPGGAWFWISDGSAVSGGNNGSSNTLWEPGEPNDADSNQATAGQEDCGAMIQSDDDESSTLTPGRWNDLACSRQLRFVCEFPLEQAP